MKIRRCPAKYERFLLASIERALGEIERDMQFRGSDDERIRSYASVPNSMIDKRRSGDLVIVVGAEEPGLKVAS